MMATNSPEPISAHFPFQKQRAEVLGSQMAYVDVGLLSGSATVFLLCNLMCAYLWRNIIPHFSGKSRLVAADLIGFGHSDKVTGFEYRAVDHQRFVDAFLDAVQLTEKLTLLLYDWGSALGIDWARLCEDRIAGLASWSSSYPPIAGKCSPR
jgi:haloalkane dehalogenase